MCFVLYDDDCIHTTCYSDYDLLSLYCDYLIISFAALVILFLPVVKMRMEVVMHGIHELVVGGTNYHYLMILWMIDMHH